MDVTADYDEDPSIQDPMKNEKKLKKSKESF